jgi:hypothetical protein
MTGECQIHVTPRAGPFSAKGRFFCDSAVPRLPAPHNRSQTLDFLPQLGIFLDHSKGINHEPPGHPKSIAGQAHRRVAVL